MEDIVANNQEDEEMGNSKYWVGSSIKDIFKGRNPWHFEIPLVQPSKYHAVLYEGPPNLQSPPKPRPSAMLRHWDPDFVRLPYSPKNLFPSKKNSGEDGLIERWALIKETLTKKPITTSQDLEQAIHSYNTRLPKFTALHFYLNEVLEEYEADHFFSNLLPGIIQLALQIPDYICASLPLLKKDSNRAVTLTQMQIACILANAFLCTFPWRRDMNSYPGVNFVRLFSAHLSEDKVNCISEKLKCITHYFRSVMKKPRCGVITFKRRHMSRSQMPRWDKVENNLGNTRVHISSTGTIEDNGDGMLQVDFANKYVGGGVLGFGCVQEEIRFVICPELIASRLFTEQLGNTEALIITGVERFSNYSGYGETFTWNGNHEDGTPYDTSGRRQTTIVAIDAQYFGRPNDQYEMGSVLREVNKAYVGFFSNRPQPLPPVATGNWGCGAFRGDPHLKFLIQLMACNAANRDMVYFTFGDDKLRDTLHNMYTFIANNGVTTAQLWKLISKYTMAKVRSSHFYPFLQQAYFDSKSEQSVTQCFAFIKKSSSFAPSTSSNAVSENRADSLPSSVSPSDDTSFDISSSQASESSSAFKGSSVKIKKFKQSNTSKPSGATIYSESSGEDSGVISEIESNISKKEEIINIINAIDGEAFSKVEDNFNQSFLNSIDDATKTLCDGMRDENLNESMEVDDSKESTREIDKKDGPTVSKRKITDYFSKVD